MPNTTTKFKTPNSAARQKEHPKTSVSYPINLAHPNSIRNPVIGNPFVKAIIATDELLVSTFFDSPDGVFEEDREFQG
ncbi:hypothetical protein CPC08DRAFT_768066 [Agrocybe pediades]|nr:hypothetical protein CPC08DRAFT_768066 [Agrocybe pediades]